MPIRQQRSEQRPGRATLGDSGVGRRQRAASLLAATAAAVVEALEEAESAEAAETQPAEGATELEIPATEPIEAAGEPRRWHIVRQQILDKKLYVNNPEACDADFRVGCAECDKRLPVAHLDEEDKFRRDEHAMVLACGHILCHGCLDRIWGNDRKEKRKLACPVCEAEMQCQHCGKKARVVAIPILFYNAETPKRVPLTLPEGGSWPSACVRCRASREWIDSAGERAVMELRQLFGEDSGQSERGGKYGSCTTRSWTTWAKRTMACPPGQDEMEKHFLDLISTSYRGLSMAHTGHVPQ